MRGAKVHPIVMYPFRQPKDTRGLSALYQFLRSLAGKRVYEKPVTVVNRQTLYRTPDTEKLITSTVTPVSLATETWSVDTCAMWLRGLGDAFKTAEKRRSYEDVFWLVPGDFDYSTEAGTKALQLLESIPMKVLEHHCSICLGEITVPPNSAKQLIDTYGTFGLLYNWFPAEAQGIRSKVDKPRTEFFALNYDMLKKSLVSSRWYAYEQTLMILLQNMNGKEFQRPVDRVPLGEIGDDESTRSTLAAAISQVERTERALKLFWRENAEAHEEVHWHDEFRTLDAQSESIRTAAMVILRRLLHK